MTHVKEKIDLTMISINLNHSSEGEVLVNWISQSENGDVKTGICHSIHEVLQNIMDITTETVGRFLSSKGMEHYKLDQQQYSDTKCYENFMEFSKELIKFMYGGK